MFVDTNAAHFASLFYNHVALTKQVMLSFNTPETRNTSSQTHSIKAAVPEICLRIKNITDAVPGPDLELVLPENVSRPLPFR
jgi:hypothetical protein